MKRKVIKQGHNTLTLTLPSKWAKRYNVQPGDELELLEQENSILVKNDKSTAIASTTLDLRGASIPVLWRSIISAYRAGYTEITVKFENPAGKDVYTGFGFNNMQWLFYKGMVHLSPIEAIQALVNRLIGVEIIDQKSNYCVIKEMSEISYKEFDNSMRRMFLLLLSMADECYDCCKNNTKEPLRSIHLIDTNLDRFEDFCLRVLNKTGYHDYKKTPAIYSSIFLLELVGDDLKKVGLHFLDLKGRCDPVLLKQFDLVRSQFRRYYELFYSFSKEKAAEIYEWDGKTIKSFEEAWPKFGNQEKEIIYHMKKISNYILSLTELRIDLEA